MTNNHRYPLLLFILAMLLTAACEQNDPQPDHEEPEADVPLEEEEVSEDLFYQLIRIENLATEITTDMDFAPTTPKPTVFFSLEDSTVRDDLYIKTNRWDLAFGHLYNSFLSGNNGDDTENYGYGANSVGGIHILAKHFDDVVDIPSDDLFRTGRDQIGTDTSGFAGAGVGWYQYDFSGELRGDGSHEKQHVAYALQDTRTVVVRTAKGNYAKIKMISCYKDAFTPEEWFRDTPHMYFTFEYVLVPAGSTQFETRERPAGKIDRITKINLNKSIINVA